MNFNHNIPFVKHTDWHTQKEIRFLITAFFSGTQTEVTATTAIKMVHNARDYYIHGIPPAHEFYDIPLNPTVLRNDIEITLGGKCHNGHKEIVKLLLNEYTDVGESALKTSGFDIR